MSEGHLLSRVMRDAVVGVAGALVFFALGCDASQAAHADSADHASAGPASGHAAMDRDTMASGSGSHGASDHDARGHGAPGAPSTMEHRELAAGEPSDFSVYHTRSLWTDQHGTERRLRSFEGRVQVVAMVYTSCAYACPRIMLDMKRIQAELGSGYAGDVGFLVVSIDPERDSPERLAEFARGSRLDPDRWTLLNGADRDIRELAVLLGVQYRETAPGEWVHSNLITVLDREGEVIHRQLGLGADPAGTLDAIRAAAG